MGWGARDELEAQRGDVAVRFETGDFGTAHGLPAQEVAVIPFPSVTVKRRSAAGSLTISFAPDGQ